MKKVLLSLLLVVNLFGLLNAQIQKTASWEAEIKMLTDNKAEIIIYGKAKPQWYFYTLKDELNPIFFTFDLSKNYSLDGIIEELSKPKSEFDDIMEATRWYNTNIGKYRQKIKILSENDFNIKLSIEYQSCFEDGMCVVEEEELIIKIKPTKPIKENVEIIDTLIADNIKEEVVVEEIQENNNDNTNDNNLVVETDKSEIVNDITSETETKSSLWWLFFISFIGGLAALITPCVFPMIPMTVSFFLRSTKSRKKAIADALFFGISIVIIYVVLGLSLSVIFGANALNAMATNPIFNLIFFILLILFAISFFGVFELRFPSKWTTALDNKADSTTGLISVFLMAFTLVLVSFSCTGPIIGTLLVEAAVSGSKVGPLVGMAGFATAMSIPFSLLAIFPSWLKSMPKSGGWLNAVKVVLAFLLLAISLKFLSTADMVAQWDLLSRPVYLALWIVIFSMMGLYLMGKIKFSHDSDLPHLSVSRLFLAIAVFTFVVYMIPGMFGAPLKFISSFLPPMTTQDFVLGTNTGGSIAPAFNLPEGKNVKSGAHGLIKFLDFDEGMKYAKLNKKPVFLDFTGLGCVNCKKMEADVWADGRVLNMLQNDYVIISLYVDDRTSLPEEKQYISDFGGRERKIRTIGNKWSDFQARNYGVNSQPYYILLDNNNEMLTEPRAYNLNIDLFVDFLRTGLEEFKKRTNY